MQQFMFLILLIATPFVWFKFFRYCFNQTRIGSIIVTGVVLYLSIAISDLIAVHPLTKDNMFLRLLLLNSFYLGLPSISIFVKYFLIQKIKRN